MHTDKHFQKPVILEVNHPHSLKVENFNVTPLLNMLMGAYGTLDFEQLTDEVEETFDKLALGWDEISENERASIKFTIYKLKKGFKGISQFQ